MAQHKLDLSALLILAASILTASGSSLILNKCCLPGDYLIEDDDTGDYVCQDHEQSRKEVRDIRSSPVGNNSSWLNWPSAVWRANDELRSELMLADVLPNDTRVRYGVRPCATGDQLGIMPYYHLKNYYKLLTNGSLLVDLSGFSGFGNVSFNPTDYCLDEFRNGSTHAIMACPCLKVTCFRKCCGERMEFVFTDQNELECEEIPNSDVNEGWTPFHGNDSKPVHHLVFAGAPQCFPSRDEDLGHFLNGERGEHRRLFAQRNGSAIFENILHGAAVASGRWCGEQLRLENGSLIDNALLCYPPVSVSLRTVIYASLNLVSAFFLLLTLLVYAVLPELRAPPHARALMCHCGTLLAASVVLAGAQIWASSVRGRSCAAIALTIQFFFLAAFFWLNVICYDISRAFSEFRSSQDCSVQIASQNKFRYYSIYAWGSTAIITSVTAAVVESERAGVLPKWIVNPNIGTQGCWFAGKKARWAYFNGPMMLLLASNCVCFAVTLLHLYYATREFAQLDRGDSARHGCKSRLASHRRRIILFSKLLLLMGLLWVFEALSPAFEGTTAGANWQVFDFWVLVDIINMLRGVFIFILVCCKRKVLRKLYKRAAGCGLVADVETTPLETSDWHRRVNSWLGITTGTFTATNLPASNRISSISDTHFSSRSNSGSGSKANLRSQRIPESSSITFKGVPRSGPVARLPVWTEGRPEECLGSSGRFRSSSGAWRTPRVQVRRIESIPEDSSVSLSSLKTPDTSQDSNGCTAVSKSNHIDT